MLGENKDINRYIILVTPIFFQADFMTRNILLAALEVVEISLTVYF